MYVCLTALELIRRVYTGFATAQRKAGLLEKAQYIEF